MQEIEIKVCNIVIGHITVPENVPQQEIEDMVENFIDNNTEWDYK